MTVELTRAYPRLRRWATGFTENLGLKTTSLLISLALFGLVRGAGTVQRSVEVGLLARLPGAGSTRVLLTELPDRVRVTVRGSPGVVGRLRADELGPVQIELSDGNPTHVALEPSLFRLPAGVQITQITPSVLQLTWDAFVSRELPIRVELAGEPGPGLRLSAPPTVTPARVRVLGPALYVDTLQGVRTAPVELTGLGVGTHERRVFLEEPRSHVTYSINGAIPVRLALEELVQERRFENVEVTAVGAQRVSLRPGMVTITLRGAPSRVQTLAANGLAPSVELPDGLTALRGTLRLPVVLRHIPEGTTLVALEPPELLVTPAR